MLALKEASFRKDGGAVGGRQKGGEKLRGDRGKNILSRVGRDPE